MSELRNKLDQLRDDYRGQRYPGDLAAEILSRRPTRKIAGLWIIAATTAVTALAASLAIYLGVIPMSHDAGGNGGGEVAVADVAPVIDLGPMPEFPADVSLVPPAQSARDIGAMPEMPSIDLSFNLSSDSESSEEMS